MKILHLDIETAPNTGLVWGLFRQNIGLEQIVTSGYTLCWAAKWDGEPEIMFSSVNDGAQAMLESVHTLLAEADAVVHYNGKSFDIPILNKEFIKHGLTPPDSYHQIDLLETVRRRFRFTSNKLDYVANFLGLGTKLHHKGMSLWVGCMNGDEKCWKTMEKYNKQDVRLLPRLYKKLLPWINDHPNHGLYKDIEDSEGNIKDACTNCGSTDIVRNGIEHLKTQSYQRFKCKSCHTPLRGRKTILLKDKRDTILTQSKL